MLDYLKVLFSGSIIWYALIVGLFLSVCAALLGVTLVLKKYSMIGDGLSHVSFAAMAVAVATGKSPLIFSLPLVIITAFLLLRISERSRITGDAAVAVVSTAALAIGAIASRNTNVDIESYLFGSIVAVTKEDVFLTVGVAVVTFVIYILFYNRIFAVTFDETYLAASGSRPALYQALIAILTAVTVVVGMRLVGALLISALILFPALSAMRLFGSFRRVVIVSAALSIISFVSALLISIFFDISTSACVVLIDLLLFGVSTLVASTRRRAL